MPEPITLELNGHRFPVVDAGTGPGVLLLHGADSTSDIWSEQVAALVGGGFRAVAPTLRALDQDTENAANIGDVLDDLHGILRTLGVPKVHVVGHGRGGLAAWMFTMTQSPKVDRLVVIDAPYPDAERFPPVDKPVLAIVGTVASVGDAALAAAEAHVSGPWRSERVEGGGPDLPVAQAARVNQLLLAFFAREVRPAGAAANVRAVMGRSTKGTLSDRLRSPDNAAE